MFGGITATGAERLVVATADGIVLTLDLESGAIVSRFGRFPLGPDRVHVAACAVDHQRNILLADERNGCVRRFRPDGLQLGRIGLRATPGVEDEDIEGVLADPCDILVLDGEVIVANGGHDVEYGVQRIGETYSHLVHPDGGWRRAHGLTRVGDEIWVAETEGGVLHRFHMDGHMLAPASLPTELKKPLRVTFDGYDGVLALFAPDTPEEQDALGVAELSLEGEFERWAVEAGEEPGHVYCPFDIALMPDGRYVVADLPTGQPPDVRLQLFSADGRLIKPLLEDQVDLNKLLEAWFEGRFLNPDDVFGQAEAHRIHARPDEARLLYQRLVDDDPTHLLARLHLASLLPPDEAEAQYRLCKGADPGDIAARVAVCRAADGDFDGAIEVLREAVEGDHPPEEYHRWVERLGTWFLERAGAAEPE